MCSEDKTQGMEDWPFDKDIVGVNHRTNLPLQQETAGMNWKWGLWDLMKGGWNMCCQSFKERKEGPLRWSRDCQGHSLGFNRSSWLQQYWWGESHLEPSGRHSYQEDSSSILPSYERGIATPVSLEGRASSQRGLSSNCNISWNLSLSWGLSFLFLLSYVSLLKWISILRCSCQFVLQACDLFNFIGSPLEENSAWDQLYLQRHLYLI